MSDQDNAWWIDEIESLKESQRPLTEYGCTRLNRLNRNAIGDELWIVDTWYYASEIKPMTSVVLLPLDRSTHLRMCFKTSIFWIYNLPPKFSFWLSV